MRRATAGCLAPAFWCCTAGFEGLPSPPIDDPEIATIKLYCAPARQQACGQQCASHPAPPSHHAPLQKDKDTEEAVREGTATLMDTTRKGRGVW